MIGPVTQCQRGSPDLAPVVADVEQTAGLARVDSYDLQVYLALSSFNIFTRVENVK